MRTNVLFSSSLSVFAEPQKANEYTVPSSQKKGIYDQVIK